MIMYCPVKYQKMDSSESGFALVGTGEHSYWIQGDLQPKFIDLVQEYLREHQRLLHSSSGAAHLLQSVDVKLLSSPEHGLLEIINLSKRPMRAFVTATRNELSRK